MSIRHRRKRSMHRTIIAQNVAYLENMPAKPSIILHIKKDDPKLVAMFTLAQSSADLLQKLIQQVWENKFIDKTTKDGALLQLLGVLGTLAWETAVAANQLALVGLSRAMHVLTRSTFEYSIRLRWYHQNPNEAVQHMNSLPRKIYEEIKSTKGAFSDEVRTKIVEGYKIWQSEHSEFDRQFNENTFTDMARSVMSETFDSEWFFLYAYPSVIAHGKPHAISDIMSYEGDTMVLQMNSRQLDINMELGKIASIITELIGFIVNYYALDFAKDIQIFNELNSKLEKTLAEQGFKVKTHH